MNKKVSLFRVRENTGILLNKCCIFWPANRCFTPHSLFKICFFSGFTGFFYFSYLEVKNVAEKHKKLLIPKCWAVNKCWSSNTENKQLVKYQMLQLTIMGLHWFISYVAGVYSILDWFVKSILVVLFAETELPWILTLVREIVQFCQIIEYNWVH